MIHRTKAAGKKEVWLTPGPSFAEAERLVRAEQAEPEATTHDKANRLQIRFAPNVPLVNASLTPIAAMALGK